MYKILTSSLVVAICAAAARGTDLNLTIKACEDGSAGSDVTVAPGADLDYIVIGVLGDDTTQGLATVGFDLVLHDDAVPPAIVRTLDRANPPSLLTAMAAFANPDGLNNPADGEPVDSPVGFGGTPSRGKLLQCGGAQNTILNDTGSFLTGTPITGVARPGSPEVLVAGTLTAPAVGDYTLAIKATCVRIDPLQAGDSSDALCTTDADCADGDADPTNNEVCKGHPFAMLIDQEVGTPPNNFFSVVPATIPEPTHLTIHVVDGAPNPCVLSCLDPSGAHDPPHNTIDAGIAHPVNDAGTNLMPQTLVLAFTGDPAGIAPPLFTVDSGGTPLTVTNVSPGPGNTATVTLSAPITPGAWTKITLCDDYCIGSMPGDAGQSGATTVDDIGALITCLNTGACHPAVCDIDRFSACTGADLATLVNLLNKAGTFTEVYAPLGTSPCVP